MKYFKKFLRGVAVVWSLITLVPIIIIILTFYYKHPSTQVNINNNSILSIDLNRQYNASSKADLMRYFMDQPPAGSFYQLLKTIDIATQDEKIKGIVLKIAASSLSFSQTQEFINAIKLFKAAGKFVAIFAHSLSSDRSKLYYLATCADSIWLQPYSDLSFTSQYVEEIFWKNLIDKLGIEFQAFRYKEYKNAYANFTDDKPSQQWLESTKELLQNIDQIVVAQITEARKISVEQWKAAVKLSLFTSEGALQAKLIDKIGYADEFQDYILQKAGKEAKVVEQEEYLMHIKDRLINKTKQNKIVILNAKGIICDEQEGQDVFLNNEEKIDAIKLAQTLQKIAKEDKVKAIILRLNTPGGTDVGSEIIRHAIIKIQSKGIPIIASLDGVSASGGVWATANCAKIVASDLTITGSIGLLSYKPNIQKLLQKFNLHVEEVFTGEKSNMFSLLRPYDESEKDVLKKILDAKYNSFIKIVSQGRKIDLAAVEKIARGRVWMGVDAKRHMLIDELGGIFKAIEVAKDEVKKNKASAISASKGQTEIKLDDELVVIEYSSQESMLKKILQTLKKNVGFMYNLLALNKFVIMFSKFYNYIVQPALTKHSTDSSEMTQTLVQLTK